MFSILEWIQHMKTPEFNRIATDVYNRTQIKRVEQRNRLKQLTQKWMNIPTVKSDVKDTLQNKFQTMVDSKQSPDSRYGPKLISAIHDGPNSIPNLQQGFTKGPESLPFMYPQNQPKMQEVYGGGLSALQGVNSSQMQEQQTQFRDKLTSSLGSTPQADGNDADPISSRLANLREIIAGLSQR